MYVPESTMENFAMIIFPFVTEVLSFGKDANARAHVITDGGKLKASQVIAAVVPSSIRRNRSGTLISRGATVEKKESLTLTLTLTLTPNPNTISGQVICKGLLV